MGALYPVAGLTLNPALAAAAMAMSSVSVISNSLRLRRAKVGNRAAPGESSAATTTAGASL
jgi:cation transport ATPase